MTRKCSLRPDDDIYTQAAYWGAILRSDDLTEAQSKAFDHWRAEHDGHAAAFSEVMETWRAAGMLSDDSDILKLRRAALRSSFMPPTQHPWMAIAAALFLCVFSVSIVMLATDYSPFSNSEEAAGPTTENVITFRRLVKNLHMVSTAVGERSTIMLEDGSTVNLNTDTTVRVAFAEGERRLFLLKGQAIFKVAHDAERPFVVYAAGRRVTALGTEFEVRIDRSEFAVTLLEGKVEVDDLRQKFTTGSEGDRTLAVAAPVELKPGERFASGSAAPSAISKEALARAISWREGRLDFESEALDVIVYEINRYSRRKVVLNDPSLAELRVSGSFKAGSVENFVAALTSIYPVQQEVSDQDSPILISWQ